MSEHRKQIRKAMVKILLGRTLARENVFANRSLVNPSEGLPGINLYFTSEALDEHSSAPRKMKRTLNCDIEVIVDGKTDDEVSDRLDDLLEQIERCLSADDTLRGTASDCILQSIDIESSAEGERPIGSAKMVWSVKYYDDFPRDARDQGLVPFDGYDAEWKVDESDPDSMAAADSADDEVTFP